MFKWSLRHLTNNSSIRILRLMISRSIYKSEGMEEFGAVLVSV